jgi:hypothetical protein
VNTLSKTLRWILVTALVSAGSFGTIARSALADVSASTGSNVQDGDNSSSTGQKGSASSGDAVAGQVTGVVSSGDASVDATNRSDNVDIKTGDANGTNSAATFTGLNVSGSSTNVNASDLTLATGALNAQSGDNSTDLTQTAEASTGDGVGGEVIGIVTSAGGSADVVAANTSKDVKIKTGDADANNDAASFVGLNFSTDNGTAITADVAAASGSNVQEGDNSLDGSQAATSSSGDGVGGQVLGLVSAGKASLDATNRSEKVTIKTGDTDSSNDAAAFVGLNVSGSSTSVNASDLSLASGALNAQSGDNNGSFDQTADATSGDGVAGQVAGVVTSAGGSADLVLSNFSSDSKAKTGDGTFNNTDQLFVGLNFSTDNGISVG